MMMSSRSEFPIQEPLPLLSRVQIQKSNNERISNNSSHNSSSSSSSPPSFAASSSSRAATSLQDRITSCHFLRTLGSQLRLPYRVLATGCVCFHRVLLYHSERQWSLHEVVAACILAAGKMEEAPRRVEDILEVYHPLLYPGLDSLEKDSDQFRQLRSRIISIEAVILSCLGYRFHIKHPYEYALAAVQRMWLCSAPGCLPPLADPESVHAAIVSRTSSPSLRSLASTPGAQVRDLALKFGHTVWQLLEQSFNGDLCLEYPPQPIALGAILLASVLHRSQLPFPSQFVIPDCISAAPAVSPGGGSSTATVKDLLHQLRWWEWFLPRLSSETLAEIAIRIWESIHAESPLHRQLTPVIQRHQRFMEQQQKQRPQQPGQKGLSRKVALRQLLEERLAAVHPQPKNQLASAPSEDLVPSDAIPWYLWWFDGGREHDDEWMNG